MTLERELTTDRLTLCFCGLGVDSAPFAEHGVADLCSDHWPDVPEHVAHPFHLHDGTCEELEISRQVTRRCVFLEVGHESGRNEVVGRLDLVRPRLIN